MAGRPWGAGLAACLALGCLLVLPGCRQPAPLQVGSVRLAALTPLHPGQPMLTDMEHRIDALQQQRAYLQATTPLEAPPAAVSETSPAYDGLPGPGPAPQVNRHSDELLQQEYAALQRTLDRNLALDFDTAKLASQQQLGAALSQQLKTLATQAAANRAKIDDEYYMPLLSARLSLEAARSWAERQPDAAAERVAQMTQQYEARLADYHAALQAQRDDAKRAEQEARARYETALREQKDNDFQALQAKYQTRLEQGKQRLATEILTDEPEPALPDLRFDPLPAGQLALETPGLTAQFQHGLAARLPQQSSATREIDAEIAALRLQCEQLRREIQTDTRNAVQAVANQHGYRVRFDTSAGHDVTPAARGWLMEYWTP